MTGIEVLAGMAAAYVVRKFRRVGRGVDQEVDHVLDAGLDSLHRAVADALSGDRALALLEEEAVQGRESERTVRRVADAIAEAADSDAEFAERLAALIARIKEADDRDGSERGGSSNTVFQKARASGRATIHQVGRDLNSPGGTTR